MNIRALPTILLVSVAVLACTVCTAARVGHAPHQNRIQVGNRARPKTNFIQSAVRSKIPAIWNPNLIERCSLTRARSGRYADCDKRSCRTVGFCVEVNTIGASYCSLRKKLMADKDRFYDWCAGCSCKLSFLGR